MPNQLKNHSGQIITALSLAIVGLSTTVQASTVVSVPENVIVVAIDGKPTGGTGLFSKKKNTYSLPAGEHTITARYDRLFKSENSDDHDIVQSSGVTIKATLVDQKSYRLGWQPEPKTLSEARRFVKQPTLIITESNGTLVASQQGAVQPSRSLIANLINSDEVPVTNPLEQLQSLWTQASAEQRQQFSQWIQQQQQRQSK
jgi:uncharacterized protein